jgi:hypothetical protein
MRLSVLLLLIPVPIFALTGNVPTGMCPYEYYKDDIAEQYIKAQKTGAGEGYEYIRSLTQLWIRQILNELGGYFQNWENCLRRTVSSFFTCRQICETG